MLDESLVEVGNLWFKPIISEEVIKDKVNEMGILLGKRLDEPQNKMRHVDDVGEVLPRVAEGPILLDQQQQRFSCAQWCGCVCACAHARDVPSEQDH